MAINTFDYAQSIYAANNANKYERTDTDYKRNNVVATSDDFSMTQFYQLMAAQLQYQDPDNPMDTAELMAQMVQSQLISAITKMSNQNLVTYASSMMGKEVTVQEVDSKGQPLKDEDGNYIYKSGKVTGVSLTGDDPLIYLDGDEKKGYRLSQVKAVGDVDMEPPKKTEGDETQSA